MLIGTTVTHDTNGTQGKKHGEALPDLAVPAGIAQFLLHDAVCTKKVAEGVLAADFIWGEDLNKIPGLTEAVKADLDSIQEKGMLETVKGIL